MTASLSFDAVLSNAVIIFIRKIIFVWGSFSVGGISLSLKGYLRSRWTCVRLRGTQPQLSRDFLFLGKGAFQQTVILQGNLKMKKIAFNSKYKLRSTSRGRTWWWWQPWASLLPSKMFDFIRGSHLGRLDHGSGFDIIGCDIALGYVWSRLMVVVVQVMIWMISFCVLLLLRLDCGSCGGGDCGCLFVFVFWMVIMYALTKVKSLFVLAYWLLMNRPERW